MANFTFNCPNCNQQLESQAEWSGRQTQCPACKATITIPMEIALTVSNKADNNIEFKRRDNVFTMSGSYKILFPLIKKIVEEDFEVIEASPSKGVIHCKNKSKAGMYVIFYDKHSSTVVEVILPDTFRPISDSTKIAMLIEDGLDAYRAGKITCLPDESLKNPPIYRERYEIDYSSLAKIMFFSSFGGLAFGPLSILTLIYSTILLSKIRNNRYNKGGEEFALFGVCVSIFVLIIYAGIIINMLN